MPDYREYVMVHGIGNHKIMDITLFEALGTLGFGLVLGLLFRVIDLEKKVRRLEKVHRLEKL